MGVVLVTGCNSGFGLATARVLAQRGDRVYATVLASDPTGTADIEVARASGLPIEIVPLDVTDDPAAASLVARIVADTGRIDGLVNSAGVSMFAAFEEVSIDDVRRMMEINFIGPVRLMQLVLPHMRRQHAGRIVNVSSGAGFMPMAWQTAYVASKHALDGVSFGIGAEVRPFGIRVSIVSPGVFATGIGGKLWPASRASDEPSYAATVAATLADWNQIVTGRDPALVAGAIAACLHSDDPPARVFVGRDCERGAEQRRRLSDDEWADFITRPMFRRRPA